MRARKHTLTYTHTYMGIHMHTFCESNLHIGNENALQFRSCLIKLLSDIVFHKYLFFVLSPLFIACLAGAMFRSH